jgi:hypothetical protein
VTIQSVWVRRDDSIAGLFRAATRLGILLFALIVLACITEEPSTSPLDIRTDPSDEGRVSGQVRAPAPGAEPVRVPGAVVELGRWQGGPNDFRDSLGQRGATPDDPRFRVIARAAVDDTGAYNLREVPRWQTLGLRVRPPAGTPYRVTYLDSLFSLGQEGRERWKWFLIILERR